MKEIGSEYWSSEPADAHKVYLLSGRTALEFIIRDILKEHKVKSVLLPSYCCHTMIEPFCRHRITVRFYDIFIIGGALAAELPAPQENEIFYYMTYFGYSAISGIDLKKIRNQYPVIIEDRTHSWLSGDSLCDSDYSYVSFRKWTGFSGLSVAEKKKGRFMEFPGSVHEKYCSLREKAAALKRAYIENGIGDKQVFLSLFNEAEELLEKDYVGYRPTDQSLVSFLLLDCKQMVEIRRRNASILMDGLRNMAEVQLVYSEMNANDVPLFVPVLISEESRSELRRYLIHSKIYCPIHWPMSDYHRLNDRTDFLYKRELSLVCDQRYTEEDMSRMVSIIKQFWKEKRQC